MTSFDDDTLTAAFARGRRLEPAEAEIAGALRRAGRPARRLGRRMTAGAAAIVLLAGGGYAVPATRAAMDDVLGAFTGYFSAGSGERAADVPGRPLRPGDDAPAWVRSDAVTDRRLIAEAGGRALYAVREADGRIGFALGDGFGISDTPEGWRREFADHAVVVLGPEAGSTDRSGIAEDARAPDLPGRALFGLTARSVARVELRYTEGPPTVADSPRGGFALIGDTSRAPESVVGFDAAGRELERVPLPYRSW